MDSRYFSQKVVEWYLKHKRNLPWRATTDPYKVWLSEIILQQTRVQQGLPYYNQFIKEFPTIKELAKATEQSVLRTWQGLGYYSRARNLYQCAHIITRQYRGIFPDNYADLLKLPGIGPYTAAAIASICYNQPVAVVDGNVFRVLARVFGVHDPVNTTLGKQRFAALANALIDKTRPALYNQAIMEFGALYCTPKNPLCPDCVFRHRCVAYAGNLQSDLPVKIKKQTIRTRYFNYIVFRHGNSLFMNKRQKNDIWKGLYDFYLLESNKPVPIKSLFKKTNKSLSSLNKRHGSYTVSPVYKHVLSHQVVFARFVIINEPPGSTFSLKRVGPKTIEKLPKPVLISRFLRESQLL
jgi:A/G-specific adenine glycosylase